MGTRTTVTTTTPTASHAAAALSAGRSAATMHQQAGTQIVDTINLLGQCIKDMTRALPFTVSGATVQAGGSGHAVNDVITLPNSVQVKVSTVSSGAITAVTVQAAGSFTGPAAPANPQAQIQTTGAGTGSSFNLTWGSADPNVATFLGVIAALS